MNSNQKKDATLGMSHGTANSKLRKNILFHLLKKHGENICFKCSELISRAEELSIEHKKPWEGRSADLFWDLDNIAFSHLRCNTRGKMYSEDYALRKIGPEGTAWCTTHQKFLPVEDFYKNITRWNGLLGCCKNCHDLMQGHGTIRGRISKLEN